MLLARLAAQNIEMSRGLLIYRFCISPKQERHANSAHDLHGTRLLGSVCDLSRSASPRGYRGWYVRRTGQLGEHWKLMTVPLDEYLVNRAGDAACSAMGQREYKGRREQGSEVGFVGTLRDECRHASGTRELC